MSADAGLSRRLILQAGAASAAIGAPGLLLAQPKPIKVGLLHPRERGPGLQRRPVPSGRCHGH